MTRFGFNLLVLVYLIPLAIADIIGNTLTTGRESEFFYYKTMFDGLLIAYAGYELWRDTGTANRAQAEKMARDHGSDVVSFSQIGALEYLYCAFLCMYAAANWWELHEINLKATGFISIITLVWSFVSLAVALLAAVQFYRLKSGALVELKRKVMG